MKKSNLFLAIALGIAISLFLPNTNTSEAQESEISGGSSCFTRLKTRKGQNSLVCDNSNSGTCEWKSGKGKDRAACPGSGPVFLPV